MTINAPRILCVDNKNNDLATSAEAYLEILRIWTRNNDPDAYLLFREVRSAGIYLSTDLTTKYQSKDAKGTKLEAIDQDKHDNVHLRALDAALLKKHKAEETEYIMARAANRKIQGFKRDHLLYWDYIICFDSRVEAELNRLYKAVENEAIIMPGMGKITAKSVQRLDIKYDEKNLKDSATDLMRILEKWVQQNLKHNGKKWTVPDKPMNGMKRTKQIVIPEAQFTVLKNKTKKWDEVQEKTKCDIQAAPKRDGTRLVTITGEEKEIQKAAKALEKFWL